MLVSVVLVLAILLLFSGDTGGAIGVLIGGGAGLGAMYKYYSLIRRGKIIFKSQESGEL